MNNTQPYPINPDRSIPWNALPELPIADELYKTVEVYEALARAKEALGRLYGRSIAIPNPTVLLNSIALKEAKDSSAIENIFTTDDELYQAFSNSEETNISNSTKEVLHYREALWHGLTYLNTKNRFDRDYFISIYQELLQNNDGIRPEYAKVYIRRGGSGPTGGKPFYTPPRGKGVVQQKLDNLIQFLNDDRIPPADPVLKMAMAHFQFEAIHPFRDGNGRAGRILNIHYLMTRNLLDFPILYMSSYILEHKNEYYERLAGVSQRADWNGLLIFMLTAVEETSTLTFQKINEILEAKSTILEAIRSETEIRRPDQLVEKLFSQPYTKVANLTKAGIYAENTARKYLTELTDMGILEKRTLQGHHYYLNLELYHILKT